MKTENLDAEYSLMYLLFSKEKYNVYRKLVDRGITHNYFSVILHRSIAKHLFEMLHKNEKYSIKSFGVYFSSVEPENGVLYDRFVEDVKSHSCGIDDYDINANLICECYAARKLFKVVNNSIDNPKGKSALELIQDIKHSCMVSEQIVANTSVKKKMGFKSGLEDRIKRAKEVHENPDAAGMVMTGLKNIDKWIGRQSPGDLCIYQARTGKGKSMMLMGTALANFKKGLKVIIFTVEMNEYSYLYRFDSNVTGIEHMEFTQGDIVTDEDKLAMWRSRVKRCGKEDSDIVLYYVPNNCTPATLEQLIEDNDFVPDLVIMDYAGDMSSGLAGVPDLSPTAQGEVYMGLKRIAGKFNCVVYTAQQSIRGVKPGKSSTETGSWSNRASELASYMFALEVTREDEDFMSEVDGNVVIGRMTISVLKARNAPLCKTHIIPRFSKMNWIEREEDEMIPCGSTKEIPTAKKQIRESEKALDKKLEEDTEDTSSEEFDILDGE